MTIHRTTITLIAALALTMSAGASGRAWEEVNRFPEAHQIESVAEHDDVVVVARDSYVYVSVRQSTDVKIFTILGQLVVRQQLKPGYYRFRLSSRGIYLLKAGSLTRRITI